MQELDRDRDIPLHPTENRCTSDPDFGLYPLQPPTRGNPPMTITLPCTVEDSIHPGQVGKAIYTQMLLYFTKWL